MNKRKRLSAFKQRREAAGLTQYDLSTMCSAPMADVEKWDLGTLDPKPIAIRLLSLHTDGVKWSRTIEYCRARGLSAQWAIERLTRPPTTRSV